MADKIVQLQLDFLAVTCETVEKSTRELKFDADNGAQLFAVCLYATNIELTRACLSLMTSGNTIGIPILLRSIHEALADQLNLLADAQYAKNMQAANLVRMEKLLEQAGDKQNPLLKGLGEKWDLPKELADVRAQLAKFRDEKRGELNIFERFKKAGMEADYRSAYVLQCLDSHSNVSALVQRHVDAGSGERVQVSLYKTPEAETAQGWLDAITAMLLKSAITTHETFKTGCKTLQPLLEQHAAMRKEFFGKKG